MTITDALREGVLIPLDRNNLPERKDILVMYVGSHAHITCDCGREVLLCQRIYGNNKYSGKCDCGLSWSLNSGKISSKNYESKF